VATYAAPHTYSLGINRTLVAGTSGYFIITVNVSSTATDNKTVRMTGSTTPVIFGYATAPNVTNNQNNGAGLQTIQAPDITLTSSTVAAGNIARGSSTNIIYVVKMNVTTAAVTVNNIQFTLTGTHDADDLTYATVYFNATAATISGASYLNQSVATYAAPHTYSLGINRTLAAGTSGYFLITVNVNASATIGKTVKLNGATDPVIFGYATAPNITNSQTNAAGVKTISSTLAAVAGNDANYNTNTEIAGKVYPNPATDAVFIELSFEMKRQILLQLTTENGRIVTSKSYTVEKGKNKLSIDVSSLPSGFYYATVQTEGYSSRVDKKVLVKH
jgi:hypothetical protein